MGDSDRVELRGREEEEGAAEPRMEGEGAESQAVNEARSAMLIWWRSGETRRNELTSVQRSGRTSLRRGHEDRFVFDVKLKISRIGRCSWEQKKQGEN